MCISHDDASCLETIAVVEAGELRGFAWVGQKRNREMDSCGEIEAGD